MFNWLKLKWKLITGISTKDASEETGTLIEHAISPACVGCASLDICDSKFVRAPYKLEPRRARVSSARPEAAVPYHRRIQPMTLDDDDYILGSQLIHMGGLGTEGTFSRGTSGVQDQLVYGMN